MFIRYRTQGIFLRKEDRGEADRLFTIFTKDFGKLKILGKGIRKISSKLISGAELFYLSEVEFIRGKSHKTLTDAVLIDKFPDMRKSLVRLKISRGIAEFLDRFGGEEPEPEIWDLLSETFRGLNQSPLPPVQCLLIYYYFFWNAIAAFGYKPSFNDDRIAGNEKISPDIIKILKIILKKDVVRLFRTEIKLSRFAEFESVSANYLNNI